MAISLVQEPTYPNASYTHLVYTISSSKVGEPQFQYVMDVTQEGELITRVKQFPNTTGNGIFDPSRIISDLLDYDNAWKITDVYEPVTSFQDFNIKFGEEYGTSLSSSVDIYNGITDSVGSPALQGITSSVFPGTVDPNNGLSYNFQSGSYALTNQPIDHDYIGAEDYYTMAFMNTGSSSVNVTVEYVPGPTETYAIPNEGIATVPISPKNVGQSGVNSIQITYNGVNRTLEIAEECNYDRVRFAFINDYGFWDYFAFNLPVARTTAVNRQSLRRPQVNYGAAIANYSSTKRGTDYYNTQYDDNFSVTTPLIDQATAQWLKEMIESPNVFIQEDDKFKPIVITNASYDHYTNLRSQKTFQYTINYQLANKRIGR